MCERARIAARALFGPWLPPERLGDQLQRFAAEVLPAVGAGCDQAASGSSEPAAHSRAYTPPAESG